MHERRKHPRYDILPIPSVTAILHEGKVPTRLGTIGLGGCGFWAEKIDDSLIIGQSVHCSISFEGILPKSIEVTGRLQYCNQHLLDGVPTPYYGVEFHPEHHHLLAPIIRHLERLERLGRVLIAVD